MAGIAGNIATGFAIGRSMQERSAQKKLVSGLQEYRDLMEQSAAGVLPTEDPAAFEAKLQQAEQDFHTGLRAGNLGMGEAAQMMTAFNQIKSQHVIKEGTQALGAWGTDLGLEPLKRTASSIRGTPVTNVEWSEQADEQGRPLAVLYYDDDNDPETPERKIAMPYHQANRLIQAAQGDPNVLMSLDVNNIQTNELYREEQVAPSVEERLEARETARIQGDQDRRLAAQDRVLDNRKTEADISASEALANQRNADAARKAAEATGPATQKLPQNMADVEDALFDYPEMEDIARGNPQAFTTGFVQMEEYLRRQAGREVTAAEVLQAMDAQLNSGG